MAVAQTIIKEEVTVVHGIPRVVWGAIVAGVLLACAVDIGLAFLGAGIGLSLTNPVRDPEHVKALSITAVIWWFSSGLVAMYLGSWVAGHFARNHGRLHGLLMWASKVAVMVVLLATSFGMASAGAFALTNPKANYYSAKNTTQIVVDPNLGPDQKRQQLLNETARNTQMTTEEVRIAAEKAADHAAKMSLLAFLMLALGAGVSALGGAHGARDAYKEVAII